jgi:hypothetical protein
LKPAATMSYDPNLPFCCIECAQLYTTTYYQQSLETFLLSHNSNLCEELEPNVDSDPIAPNSAKGPDAGSSKTFKSVSRLRGPRHTTPETKRLNISRNNRDDPSITTPTRSPRNARKSGERHGEPKNKFEYNQLTSSVPPQNPSNRAQNRQNRREAGVSNSGTNPRKPNDDLPPIPTCSSNSEQQPQETRSSYSLDEPQALVGPPSIPVQTDERNQSTNNYAQIRPLTHTRQPRVTRISFSATKPRDSDPVEPPSVPIQEKSQSNFSQIYSQSQETQASESNKPQNHIEPPSCPIHEKSQSYSSQTHPQSQETQASNKPRDHIEPSSDPIQEKSRSNFSQTHTQPPEIQASSYVNKSRDSAERPKTSIPTQDQGHDHNAPDASKTDTRPHLMHGTPTQMDTQYVSMLLALDDIPNLHNMLAKFFNWILLAGFILFPGTFTSLRNLGGSGQIEQQLVHAVTSIPL